MGAAVKPTNRLPNSPGFGPSRRAMGRVLGAMLTLWLGGLASVVDLAWAGRGAVVDPGGETFFQVSFREAPTHQDLAEAQAALTGMAALVCDATEGQVRFTKIRLLHSPANDDLAGFWFHSGEAASGGPYDPSGGDLHRLGSHMDVFASARLHPDRLAHLFSHHAFGLGDQYDDQRRKGAACGVGPGFEASRLSETDHSIMQSAGGMRCASGHLVGQACLRDDECGGAECGSVFSSEFSIPSNHDALRGDGVACPKPSGISRVRLGGTLPGKAEPMVRFDAKDFLTARATSVWYRRMEVLGSMGTLPGIDLDFYISHLSRLEWQLTVAGDAGQFGGHLGDFRVLQDWALTFNDDHSLASAKPEQLRFEIPASTGREPVEVAIDIGVRNPDSVRHPGQGYDGLQMVVAGEPELKLVVDGVVGCDAVWCASSWNEATRRWELSEQSILHRGQSDWETLVTNLPFLKAPLGGVAKDAPAACRTPPEFVTEVMGADQVVFILDTSRSMGLRVDGKTGEVCANGDDDDGDGAIDEADCADSRLEYQLTAVRAFMAMAENRSLQVGMVAMHTDAEIVAEVAEVSDARQAVLGAVLGSLEAEGDTALGTALERAQDAMAKVQRLARSRSIIALSDGSNNVGVAPGHEERSLDPLLYRVFPVAIGDAADAMALSAIGARGGGVTLGTQDPTGVVGVLAELAARHGGHALLLPRTMFELERPVAGKKAVVPPVREFEVFVEEGARELVVFFSSRGARIDDWKIMYDLRAPDGGRIDDTLPQTRSGHGYAFATIQDPKPGRWTIRVLPGGLHKQSSEVLAYSSHDNAEFFVDADPRLVSVLKSVHLSARPSYGSDIDGDVQVGGVVRRPDGSVVPVTLLRNSTTGAWGLEFKDFAGRGLYEVRLRLRVGASAEPTLGEPVFPGPSRSLVRVVPFDRYATASFYVADGPTRTCKGEDCDGDGLPDRLETVGSADDVDRDGLANRVDPDSDNDEVFDGEEGTGDQDKDGVPDFCDPETTPVSLSTVIEAEEAALAAACNPDGTPSREGLRASLSATRRLVQVLRTRPGIAPNVRVELVQRLQEVIGLKKQAMVIAEVLPEFCGKFKSRLEASLHIEREMRVRVDPYLGK